MTDIAEVGEMVVCKYQSNCSHHTCNHIKEHTLTEDDECLFPGCDYFSDSLCVPVLKDWDK